MKKQYHHEGSNQIGTIVWEVGRKYGEFIANSGARFTVRPDEVTEVTEVTEVNQQQPQAATRQKGQ